MVLIACHVITRSGHALPGSDLHAIELGHVTRIRLSYWLNSSHVTRTVRSHWLSRDHVTRIPHSHWLLRTARRLAITSELESFPTVPAPTQAKMTGGGGLELAKKMTQYVNGP